MNRKVLNRRSLAYSLVEVLVGLAITGGALIVLTSVAINAYKQVQDNELADEVNRIMLMPIEYLKTPVSDPNNPPASILNSITAVNQSKVYKIDNIEAQYFSISEQGNQAGDLTSCDENSSYYIQFPSTQTRRPIVCNKIVITRTSNGGYSFTSSIAYKTYDGKTITSKIVGYKKAQ